jgi:hypothetical protein
MNKVTAATAILEMMQRNMQTKETAKKNGCEYMVHQYEHAIHELAIAYSIAESADENNPLTVSEVEELAKEHKPLYR